MNRLQIFLLRAGLGALFAVILTRIFFPQANPFYMAGLGIFLVGMAYLFEAIRGSKKHE